jgi:hypothetical protein
MDRRLRTRSNIGMGVPGSLHPPRSQSVRPTTFAPTPASQSPPACDCSIVWLRIRPSESKSKTNSPVKALSGSTPRPNGSERAMTPRFEGLQVYEPFLFSHQRTTSCSGIAPARRGRNVRGSVVMRSARTSIQTLPRMGTRFQARGEVQRAAL